MSSSITPEQVNNVLSAVFHGIDYSKVQSIASMFGQEVLSKYKFDKIVPYLEYKLYCAASWSMFINLEKETEDICVLSDCGWNHRGFCSPMGTVTFIGAKSRKVIAVCPLINATKYKNYDGSSKSMEGAGTELLCKQFFDKGLKITEFLHDGDSSALNSVRKYFPDCVEKKCVNHYAKCIGKWAATNLGKPWRYRIQAAIATACREASKSENPMQEFAERLRIAQKHYKGEHDLCKHKFSIDEKDNMTPKQLTLFHNKLVEILALAPELIHGANQSVVESFNMLICKFAPKNTCSTQLYISRVYMAVLCKNEGPGFILNFMKQLSINPTQQFVSYIDLCAQRYNYQLIYRHLNARKPVQRIAISKIKSEHKYKEKTKCNCKKSCGNGHCGCRKEKNICVPGVCGCSNELCTNRTVDEPLTNAALELSYSAATLERAKQ